MGMRISLRWNREPEWFFSLAPSLQVKLIAEYRLSIETEKQRKERRNRYNEDRLEQRLKQHEEHHNNRPKRTNDH